MSLDTTASRNDQPSPGSVDQPPRWFDVVALAVPVLVATVGGIGVLLAVLGVYSTWLALLLGLVPAAAMLVGAARVLPRSPTLGPSSPRTLGAVAAVLIAVGYAVFAGSVPSQNVIATRDPGVYLNTARWLSYEGDLDVDADVPAFVGVDGLRFESAGVYDMGGGDLEFQFNHLPSVVMTVAYDLGGYRLLFRTPALVTAAGLLAVYAVAVRVTRRPLVALLAPSVFAVSMPLLYVARNTYSEPFAFALLWGAALAVADLHRRPRLVMALIGGAAMGALVSTRVDALLYVALSFPLAAVSIMSPGSTAARWARARAWTVVAVAAGVVSTIGVVDLLSWTGRYALDLSSQLTLLRAAVAASAVASVGVLVIWRYVPAVRRVYARTRGWLAWIASGLVVTALLVGWLVRPLVQVVHSTQDYEIVGDIQKRDGVPVDPSRIFSEDSLRWMAWYLGEPTLIAAVVGLAVVIYLGIKRGRVTPAAVGVCALTLAGGAMYWWKPSITPDHLWATRRFVPAVFPSLAVMATVPLGLLAASSRIDRRARAGVVGVLALALLVPPAVTTWPLRWQREQYGYLNTVEEACELLPDDAAVVIVGGYASATLQQTIRSWCEVPTAGQGQLTAETLPEAAQQVARNGYQLTLLGADSRDLASYLDLASDDPVRTHAAADRWTVQRTLDRAPDRYVDYERSLPVEVPFRLHLLVVDDG